jgi:glycosyltransferase involved in cell wall biosynthesis
MKYLSFPLFVLLLLSCGSTKDINLDEESVKNPDWTFENIASIIYEEFPEAYEDLIDISFSRAEMRITPEQASFLIPSRYFEKKLTQEVCEERTRNVLDKMTGYRDGCHEVEIGKSQEYAWHSWEDKVVTKVTIYFAIGC